MHLKENKLKVLALWEERIRMCIPASEKLGSLTLINSLPGFIDELVEALISPEKHGGALQKKRSLAKEHGEERGTSSVYNLMEVLREYQALQQIIFEVLEREMQIDSKQRDIILNTFAIGVQNAAQEFIKYRNDQEMQSKKKLRDKEERLRLATKAARVGIWDYDLHSGKVRWSEEQSQIYGLPPSTKDLTIEYVRSMIHPDDRELILNATQEALESDTEFCIEHRIIRPDGEVHWLLGTGKILRDENGKPVRFLGTNMDIDRQKKIQERMTQEKDLAEIAHEELHRLFMQAPVAMVMLTGPEHRFTLANPLYEHIVGRKVTGKKMLEVFTKEEAVNFIPLLDGVYRTGKPYIGKELLLDITDESGKARKHFINLIYHPLRDQENNITGIFAVVHDVTDQVKALNERQLYIEELKEERELRERFTDALTHDLRTPLAAAKMSAQLVLKYRENEEKRELLLHKVVESLERTDKMIEDLLDANRIKAGEKLPLKVVNCDVRLIAEQSLDELAITYGSRFVLTSGGECKGFWSCEGLRRVLDNLINNAIKYGAADEPVTVTIECHKNEICLSVHNFGEPLLKGEVQTLFKPFYRAKAADKGEQRGWGIGLTLVKGIVEAHGGRVEVDSEANKGTTFTVILPRDCRSVVASKGLLWAH